MAACDQPAVQAMRDSVELRAAIAAVIDELGVETIIALQQRLFMEYFLLLAGSDTTREIASGLFAIHDQARPSSRSLLFFDCRARRRRNRRLTQVLSCFHSSRR